MAEDFEEDFDESAGADEADGSGQAPSPRKNKKKLLIILVPVLFIVGAVGALYFTGAASSVAKMFHKTKPAATAEETEAKPGTAEPVIAFVDIPEMTVNLNSPGPKQNYAKLKIKLQLANSLDQAKVENALPHIVDSFQTHIRQLRMQDLQGSSGLSRFRSELLRRAQAETKENMVTDVLFDEFLIQ